MDPENERLHILDMIDRGEISAGEGLQRLQSLSAGVVPAKETAGTEAPAANAPAGAAASSSGQSAEQGAEQVLVGETLKSTTPLPPSAEKWRQWWTIPLWIGVGITLVGSLFMYAVFLSNGFGFWFLCAGVPFTFGLLLIILAVESRRAKWLHLRVQQEPGSKPQHIAFSFPLPLGFSAWFFRTFGRYIPSLQDTAIDEIITALGKSATPENPVYVSVNEGEHGEKVEIYIG
jgi:hypothetical protein